MAKSNGTWSERYRPADLDNIVGQADVVQSLKALKAAGCLDGGLVFQGPTGTGKTTTARALARALGCNMHWDYSEVGAAECTVDKVREIGRNARFAASNGGYRVWLIDECHCMSTVAFDAWKTVLQDAGQRRIFIFCTTDSQRMQRETAFRHRCTVFDFALGETGNLLSLVKRVAAAERVPAGVDLQAVVNEAEGSYRQALTVLQKRAALASAGLAVKVKMAAPVVDADARPVCRACGEHAMLHARGLCLSCYNRERRQSKVAIAV